MALAVIGVSLSEPHTSMTSLRTYVCMFACLRAWTDHLLNERVQIFHEDRYRETCEGQWRSDCQSAASVTGPKTSRKLNVLVPLVGSLNR